ncbi:MAG TPA: ThuA domain-containing protein [Kiritimatiellia bacterium]|nr:ThuA domain-containing protein [Kiritimatiellia bacterium]
MSASDKPIRNALVVWGGWDGHTPEQSANVFVPFLREQGFEVQVEQGIAAYADAERMQRMDLVVQCVTMSTIKPEERKGLCEAVAAGTGFAGWHGGIIDSFRQETEYQFMTGAQWVAHPGNCIPSYSVQVVDPGHEITRGINAFELRDTEQYYIHADPGLHVLCTTRFSGEHGDATRYPAGVIMPYAYTRRWGAGRVFVACWGHTFKDFDVPEARTIVQRGLLWSARENA